MCFEGKTLEASCNLQCIAENDAEISKDFGPAPDGTDCYLFSVNLPGRCVAGECIVSFFVFVTLVLVTFPSYCLLHTLLV